MHYVNLSSILATVWGDVINFQIQTHHMPFGRMETNIFYGYMQRRILVQPYFHAVFQTSACLCLFLSFSDAQAKINHVSLSPG